MIARSLRMFGFNVFFPIGIDRNGIPVEKYAEKRYGIKIFDLEREKFLDLCKNALDELEREMLSIMKMIGMSCDFKNCYRTDSKEFRMLTQSTFIELWNKGLIYVSTRPNNYCFECRTTLADADIVYQKIKTSLVYIKFQIKEIGDFIVVATTRPELLCSCQAILVNPEDERYKIFHNKTAIVPIYEREVPIIPHPEAKKEFGTGALMVCSYGDFSDVRLFRELNLKEIIAINLEGKMTSASERYEGMSIEDARKEIVKDLKEMGFIEKIEEIEHNVPTCERSGIPIEIIPMPELYLRQIEFSEKIKKLQEKIKFFPEFHRQILINWINSLKIDWPISRRRYYGTEIPIWYCKKCRNPNLPEKGNYYRPWKENPPFKYCKFCGSNEFEGETRTFDTWFDSSITPLFISNFENKELFKRLFPNFIRPQGKDIVRTWLYYTLLRCYQLTKKPAFKNVWIFGMGLDERGRPMHRHLGNVIDPIPLLEKYGADCFRFWSSSESSLGYDFRCSERRIEKASKFLTKLLNIGRFISQFPLIEKVKSLESSDRWIIAEFSKVANECIEGYKKFNFFIPSTKLKEFLWKIFADHYLELVKKRLYGEGFSQEERNSAFYALHFVFKNSLILLAPIIPFISDYIWKRVYSSKSIHLERFKKFKRDEDFEKYSKKIIEFNSFVWKKKKEMKKSLKDEIEIEIPPELLIFKKDLVAMHNIKGY